MGLLRLGETLKRAAIPVVFVGSLAISGCSEDNTTREELQDIYNSTSEQCNDAAEKALDDKFPEVEISDNPDVAELSTALDSMKSRETEGEAFMTDAYDECMEINFYGFKPEVSPETTNMAPPSTLVTTTQGN